MKGVTKMEKKDYIKIVQLLILLLTLLIFINNKVILNGIDPGALNIYFK
ncbi:TPA: hypothetical protein ACGO7H_001854 [Streptococcus suis]